MNLWTVLGAVGSIASIIALLLPTQTKHQRLLHLAYGLAIFALTATAVRYWNENNRIHNVERTAMAIVNDRQMGYTDLGFIQASMAFLEKNKDLYPDTYIRAKQICEDNKAALLSDGPATVNIEFEFDGMLRGIGTIEGSAK